MIIGKNASYSPAWYFVLDNLVWRYDGVCVDRCVNQGRLRSEAELEALNERMARCGLFQKTQADKDFAEIKRQDILGQFYA